MNRLFDSETNLLQVPLDSIPNTNLIANNDSNLNTTAPSSPIITQQQPISMQTPELTDYNDIIADRSIVVVSIFIRSILFKLILNILYFYSNF